MKKLLTTAGLLFCLQADAQVLNYDIEQDKMMNGLTVLTLVDPLLPTVSLQIFVRAGSRDEVIPGKTGLAHIFEHLMFRGTKKFPNYEEALLATGAENNADTASDRTRYYENVKAEFLPQVVRLEADRFRRLEFSKTAFANELGPVRQEREKGVDNNPSGFLSEKLAELAYTTHTYKHDTIGSKTDIINMKYADALEFYRSFYQPKKIFIVVVGNFNRNRLLEQIARDFGGDWKRTSSPAYQRGPDPEPPQLSARTAVYTWKDSVTPPLIYMGYHIPRFSLENREFCALELTEKLLLTDSAPLMTRLTQELKLLPPGGLWGGASRMKDPGLYLFYASLRTGSSMKDVERVRKEIARAVERLGDRKISDAELKRAVNQSIAGLLYSLTTAGELAEAIGELYLLTNYPLAINQLPACYQNVTAAEVKEVVAKYLTPGNLTSVILMPKESPKDADGTP